MTLWNWLLDRVLGPEQAFEYAYSTTPDTKPCKDCDCDDPVEPDETEYIA